MQDKPITDSDKQALRGMVSMGCASDVAAQTLGWTPEQLADTLRSDPAFALEVSQAKGKAHFHFVRSLHSASKDEKNWRAATWWLERRAQKQFGRNKNQVWTDADLVAFLDALTQIVVQSVHDPEDGQRLLAELGVLAQGTAHTTEAARK